MKTILTLSAAVSFLALAACAPTQGGGATPTPGGEATPVACTTCPVTEDYSPYRLNIFYNQQTGLVEQVRCG